MVITVPRMVSVPITNRMSIRIDKLLLEDDFEAFM